MSTSPNKDPLSASLAEWHVNPPRNPEFRSAVWARLQAAARPTTWSMFVRTHPAMVSVLLFGAIIAGAWTGRSEAREQTQVDRETIAANYVHALDARWMRHR